MMDEITLKWLELFMILTIVLQIVALVFSISTNYKNGQIQKAQKFQTERFKASLPIRKKVNQEQGTKAKEIQTNTGRYSTLDKDEIHTGYKL